MFRCESCKKTSKRGEQPVRVVISTREKWYPEREEAHPPAPRDPDRKRRLDPGGRGFEIEREVVLHSACAVKHGYIAAKEVPPPPPEPTFVELYQEA